MEISGRSWGGCWESCEQLSCGVVSVRAEKFFLFFSCALVIELFIVALILAVCFMSLLLRHYYQYFAIVISSAVIPSSL